MCLLAAKFIRTDRRLIAVSSISPSNRRITASSTWTTLPTPPITGWLAAIHWEQISLYNLNHDDCFLGEVEEFPRHFHCAVSRPEISEHDKIIQLQVRFFEKGPVSGCLQEIHMRSAPPRTFTTSATFLFLCRSYVTFRANFWSRTKHPSFSEEPNAWIDVRNNFHNFLGKHGSEMFALNKILKKHNLQHKISLSPRVYYTFTRSGSLECGLVTLLEKSVYEMGVCSMIYTKNGHKIIIITTTGQALNRTYLY